MNAAIERFVKAIGYPIDEIERTEGPISLLVDEMTIKVIEDRGDLILRFSLGSIEEVNAADILGFAAGRVLKEAAVAAFDPALGEVFLWQKLAAKSSENAAVDAFERFMTSCEWWKAAIGAELSKPKERVADEFMRIMP